MRTTINIDDAVHQAVIRFRKDKGLEYRETSVAINRLLRRGLEVEGYPVE